MNIVLAENHKIVRMGLKVIVESIENFNIAGEATNGQEVFDLLNLVKKVDLVLADMNLPMTNGISLTKEVANLYPDLKIIILSTLDHDDSIRNAFSEGASGYLLKNVSSEELIFAINQVHAGKRYLSSEITSLLLDKLMETPIPDQGVGLENLFTSPSKDHDMSEMITIKQPTNIELSPRELEVLNLTAQGLTNQEISEQLFLSKRTIEGHRQSLIEKTGSKNTAALIRYSVLAGLIQ